MKSARRIAVMLVAVLALGGVLAIAPAGAGTATDVSTGGKAPKANKKNTFVGAVANTDALVGIVIGKESAVAYLCDGTKIDFWLTGAESNGILALESEDGSTLVARRAGKTVRGHIFLSDNSVLPFEADRATGNAGVFRKGETVDGVTLAETWVRLADGTTKGAGGIAEGTSAIEQLVEGAPPDPQGVREAIDEVIADIADQAELKPPPPLPTVPERTGPGFLVDVPDLQVAPQIPSVCPVGQQKILEFCVDLPFVPVPADPPDDAVPPVPPPLDETIAGTPAEVPADTPPDADLPEALGPSTVVLPTEPVFDDKQCGYIDTGVTLLADEISGLDEDDLERQVLFSVFSHLWGRGFLGGCVDDLPSPVI